MLNADSSLASVTYLTTEQIQKYLEENKQLILTIMEGQNMGKSGEVAQYQAKLQQNLTFLAKLADAQPQAPVLPQDNFMIKLYPILIHFKLQLLLTSKKTVPLSSQVVMQQGQGSQQPHIAMSQQQPDVPMLPFDMKDQQQHHPTISLQQPDLSTSKLPFQMNDQQQQLKQPAFFQQQQLLQGQVNRFPGANSGSNQSPQTRLGINLSGKQEINQHGLDASSSGSLGKSPLGRNNGNT
ncbi:GRF1-interacting factor 2-like isoform X1 [Prosopis cineraria]|uniref:GRF1-interacting factor 2-like isoform X1 n=1 Tax=Prosopis cineraria TaxID=364024 RepID=UPI00240EEBD9|nr:GRF1-interacting factor 2-like isoform X1 [Prosopis cineraria]XP_054799531.1 GRF1-interacting factor 2-like isoform X1 [Prosopis cineraria]